MAEISWVYQVTDSADSSALEGVNVWATSDIEGLLVLDTGTTNVYGYVTLELEEDEDVFIWHSLAGYTFTNPNVQTVTDGETGSGTGTAIVAAVPDAITARVTVLDLINDSFGEIGIKATGEELQIEDAKFGLQRLNMMLDSWKTHRLLTYRMEIARHTLTADQQVHTIGPSGDFVADRPTRIIWANLVDTSVSPEYHQPIHIIESASEWLRISQPAQSSSQIDYLYCDYAFPDASIYLFPYPSVAYDLELCTWHQMERFHGLTESLLLPPGYYEALMLSLAERLCSSYGVPLQTRTIISQDAARARGRIKTHNSRAPLISTIDAGMPGVEAP